MKILTGIKYLAELSMLISLAGGPKTTKGNARSSYETIDNCMCLAAERFKDMGNVSTWLPVYLPGM